MIKSFLKTSSYYFISNLISKALNLLIFSFVARQLSIDEMGNYAILTMGVTFLGFLMTLEVQSGFTRFYFETKKELRNLFQSSIINLLILVNILMGAMLFLVKPWIEKFLVPIDYNLFCIFVLIPLSNTLSYIYIAKLKLEEKYKKVSIVVIIQSLLYGAFVFLFINIIRLDKIFSLFLGLLFQNIFVFVLYLIEFKEYKPNISYSLIKQSIRFSSFLVPSSLGAYLSLFSGKYIAGKTVSLSSAGIYEINNKISSMLIMFMEPLYQAFIPVIYSNYKKADFEKKYYMLIKLILGSLFFLILFFSLFNDNLINLFAGAKYVAYSNFLYIFLIIAVLQFVSRLLANNIHLSQKSQYDTLVEVTSGILNIVLCYYLSLSLNLWGIVWGLAISYFVRFLMYYYFSNKLFPRFYIKTFYFTLYLFIMVVLIYLHYLVNAFSILSKSILFIVEMSALLFAFLKYYNIPLKEIHKALLQNE